MQAVDLIARKRDGGELSTAEIEWLITGYTQGSIPDYQMAAWAMAVVWRGMNMRETTDLTLAMARSGSMLNLSDIAPVVGDKHSTGGVGDKTTLLVAPLVAAAGLPIAKMSGRALGFSGGTIDKLESIPGLRTDLPTATFRHILRQVGLVIAAQTDILAPADKKLYTLRGLTATIDSLPLIASSVMSKKLAAGCTCLVLDVKYGSGAFMRSQEQARRLAQTMVAIGERAGRRVRAVLSSMEQPLGKAIGNALEVTEAVQSLRGKGPADLVQLSLQLGTQLLCVARLAPDEQAAHAMLKRVYTNGDAWELFCRMVQAQGGDCTALHEPARLPSAPVVLPLQAAQSGYVAAIDARALGIVLNDLGGGRVSKQDTINPAVGLVLVAKAGDFIAADDPLLFIHASSEADARRVMPALHAAYTLTDTPAMPPPLIAETITVDA